MTHIENYSLLLPKYETFTQKLYILISDLIKIETVDYHIIDKRTKTIESFQEKIERKSSKYKDPLSEITDLAGLRVILYYQDDIDKIIKLLKKEFDIDHKNSNYDSNDQNPNEFGYNSTHIVISLKKKRLALPEWSLFSGLKAEIQIRSVLQHAWASISHALQYKSKEDIPAKLQRQLFRMAGLFELADEEFLSIRDKHFELVTKITSINKIESSQTSIDLLTIKKYVENVKLVEDLFSIAIDSGFTDIGVLDEEYRTGDYSDLVSFCYILGIKKIRDLHQILLEIKEDASSVFKALINLEKATNPENNWYTSKEFVIVLLLVKKNIDTIKAHDLISSGWSENIALRTIEALK